LNDSHIPFVLERAREAGARRAFITSLRLPGDVKDVFHVRLRDVLPAARLRKIESAVRELRGGKLDESAYHLRMGGVGERWKSTEALFTQTCRRLGYEIGEPVDAPNTFRRPDATGQLSLFDLSSTRVQTSP
jgi:DNA repair photolyase